MIKGFKPKIYQETIFATAVSHNTLVVLPTGMGKTNIFLMIAAHRLKNHPNSKILLIGPTRPLINQYLEVFKKNFDIDEDKLAVFTGQVSPEKRAEMWKSAKIIFSTPQGLENDIITDRINLQDVSLLGIDEAHRAVGEYSYVWIAKQYYRKANFPRIVGLTASPGSDLARITEICKNLFIEEIEVRTAEDPDVKPYIQEIEIKYVMVDLPTELVKVKKSLEMSLKSKLTAAKKYGYLKSSVGMTKKELLGLQASLHGQIARGQKDFQLLKTISLLAEAMKVSYALELIETQGVAAAHNYFEKIKRESLNTKVKAVKNLMLDVNFRTAWIKTEELYIKKIEHPKLLEIKKIIEREIKVKNSKIIIFSHYRESAKRIKTELDDVKGAIPELFVGQTKTAGSGLTQKQQKKIIDDFREGIINILIATSVGEEGLDIPQVNLVVFYEPVPSAIRHIQRIGRTGRQEKGKAIVLVTRNTRDEAFRWVAHHREKRMHSILRKIKSTLKLEKPEITLNDYVQKKELIIIADVREKGSGVIKELSEREVRLELKTLPTADYICSSRVGVEVKKVKDFVDSIIDGRLLHQLKSLKKNFERPVVIIEGEEDIYSVRRVHPNAIQGMIATIAVSYGIPLIRSKDYLETASLLVAIARREQEKRGDEFTMRGERKPLTVKEQQEYIVSSLPGVDRILAKELLRQFRSAGLIMGAPVEQLQKTRLIGEKKAKDIRSVLDAPYVDD